MSSVAVLLRPLLALVLLLAAHGAEHHVTPESRGHLGAYAIADRLGPSDHDAVAAGTRQTKVDEPRESARLLAVAARSLAVATQLTSTSVDVVDVVSPPGRDAAPHRSPRAPPFRSLA